MSNRNDILYAMISGLVQHATEYNSMATNKNIQANETEEGNNGETEE